MADVYWYGGTGNWSDHANHWSNTSGGALGLDPHGAAPGTDDNALFNNLSFTGASQVVTVDAIASCLNLDFTGSLNTPTLTYSYQIDTYGDITFIAAMVVNGTSSPIFKGSRATCKLTSNTLVVGVGITTSSTFTGTLTLQDNLTLNTKAFTHNGGTVDINGKTVSGLSDFNEAGATARTLTLGNATINTAAWNYTGSGLTLTANTSTINVSGTGAFAGGGATTYNNVNLNGTAHTVSGNNSIATLVLKADTTQTITFTDGTTQTITTPTFTGSAGKVKTLQGSGSAGWNITKAGGGVVQANYMTISNSKAGPGGTWRAGINSTNGGGNTGWLWDGKVMGNSLIDELMALGVI